MARPTIIDLKLTEDRCYWPSLAAPGRKGARFEPVRKCNIEDDGRVCSALRASTMSHDKRFKKKAKRLAHKLAYRARKEKPPKTQASSRYMRRKRNAVISHAWQLVDHELSPVAAFTAIKRGWEFTPEELDSIDPRKLMKAFLTDLNRAGSIGASGWILAWLHGEFEEPTKVYRLHVHGIAAGGMIDVVNSLRKSRRYKSTRKKPRTDAVFQRVRIYRNLTNLPYPLTYACKSYWPLKVIIQTANGPKRTRDHRRIPEPYHTQALIWLDRWTLNDITLLVGLKVSKSGLKRTRPARNGR